MSKTSYTADELLDANFDAWAINEASGTAHVMIRHGLTACGIKYRSAYIEATEPTDHICGRCRRSRDEHARREIAKIDQ